MSARTRWIIWVCVVALVLALVMLFLTWHPLAPS
jgi:hypothetical protein